MEPRSLQFYHTNLFVNVLHVIDFVFHGDEYSIQVFNIDVAFSWMSFPLVLLPRHDTLVTSGCHSIFTLGLLFIVSGHSGIVW